MSLKKKIFMAKKLWWDIRRGDEFYKIADDFTSRQLGEYYFVFNESSVSRGKDQSLIKNFDEDGIPLNSTYIDVAEKKMVYFPISIGQLGLAVFHTYLETGSKLDQGRFLKFADWFLDNGDNSPDLGVRWLTEVELPAYQNPGPWQSAFSQSRGISILLRAYQITGRNEYADCARAALKSFSFPVGQGGVISATEWGPFFEEYTAAIPTLVLNGHIFSWFGLLDFQRCFPDDESAENLVESGYETIINCLPDFDLGYWSRYNFCQADFYPEVDPATLQYQRLHILLLKALSKFRSHEILDHFIERWNNQIKLTSFLRSGLVKYRALKKLGRV